MAPIKYKTMMMAIKRSNALEYVQVFVPADFCWRLERLELGLTDCNFVETGFLVETDADFTDLVVLTDLLDLIKGNLLDPLYEPRVAFCTVPFFLSDVGIYWFKEINFVFYNSVLK